MRWKGLVQTLLLRAVVMMACGGLVACSDGAGGSGDTVSAGTDSLSPDASEIQGGSVVLSLGPVAPTSPELGAASELSTNNSPADSVAQTVGENDSLPIAVALLPTDVEDTQSAVQPLAVDNVTLIQASSENQRLQDACERPELDATDIPIPQMEKPSYLQSYTDPGFDSRVVRITDSAEGEVTKPLYSTIQAWNADESYLMLYRTGGSEISHQLYDGRSYVFIKNLDIKPADLEQVFWSRTDPDVFYYMSRRSGQVGSFRQFSVQENQSLEIARFTEQCGSGLPGSGGDVQMQAVNDDLFGFSCQQDDGHHIMFSYQISTGKTVTAPIGTGTPWAEWSAPAPTASGDRFWHQGFVLGSDLLTIEQQLDMDNWYSHASTGLTATRQDAYYQTAFNVSPNGCDGDVYSGVGHLVEHNLETGGCRSIISQQQGYPYTTSSTHVSSLAYRKPERVVMSSIGRSEQFEHFTNGIAAPALLSEVYMAQTTRDDTFVCRLAHHRSYGKAAQNGGYAPYFGEPHATISPSGTRVLFGSDWYDSGSVDSYVVELSDWQAQR